MSCPDRDGWMDRRRDGWIDGWRWMDRRMDGDGWMDIDGRIDGWMVCRQVSVNSLQPHRYLFSFTLLLVALFLSFLPPFPALGTSQECSQHPSRELWIDLLDRGCFLNSALYSQECSATPNFKNIHSHHPVLQASETFGIVSALLCCLGF